MEGVLEQGEALIIIRYSNRLTMHFLSLPYVFYYLILLCTFYNAFYYFALFSFTYLFYFIILFYGDIFM